MRNYALFSKIGQENIPLFSEIAHLEHKKGVFSCFLWFFYLEKSFKKLLDE
jgi:hypothetical protein